MKKVSTGLESDVSVDILTLPSKTAAFMSIITILTSPETKDGYEKHCQFAVRG
jgi:hypothetical protein